jgi:hypothetical protein
LESGTSTLSWANFVDWEPTVSETASLPIIFLLDGLDAWQRQESGKRLATGGRSAIYEPAPVDFWLEKCLRLLGEYRKFRDDWNGEGAPSPLPASLDTIEWLVSLIASLPSAFRPQLSLDPLGRPSLVTRANGKYLHLTVEQPYTLTWYSCEDSSEDFEDEYPFDGSKLPGKLINFLG